MFRELDPEDRRHPPPSSRGARPRLTSRPAADAFWELGLWPWGHCCRWYLLVTEAGGLISDLAGESRLFATGNLVAGTPKIFTQVLPIIRSHLPATIAA